MIICDYIDRRVKSYIRKKSGRVILTFFKEPFDQYDDSNVFFIDDILNESDYKKIDEFVGRTIKIAEEVFSKYLKVNGYNLFDYLKVQAKRDFSKIYKYKYAVDKFSKEQMKSNIVFFSSEFDLLEWLKQDYIIAKLPYNAFHQSKARFVRIKLKIKAWVRNSHLVHYIVGQLFDDHRNMSNYILWLGGRSLHSKLMDELQKEFKLLLFQNQLIVYTRSFAKKKIKYSLLKLKDGRKSREEWNSIEQQYAKGLNRIASLMRLKPELLEIVLKISQNNMKELLTTLLILQENDHNSRLLFVSQSIKGVAALAADYFSRNSLPSIEMLHGVPGVAEVGKTTKVAVFGQRDKSFLKSQGVDESKLVITGCPYYDKFFDIEEQNKSFDFLLLILDWIGFEQSASSQRVIFTEVMHMLKLLQHLKHEQLVVKLHPSQREKELEYVQHLVDIAGIHTRVKVMKNADTIDLLKKAKIVFTHASSVGLEALLMKKPLIVLPRLLKSTVNYGEYNGCFVPENRKELLYSTEEILRDVHGYLSNNKENIERTIKYFSRDVTGQSYKKVANLCREMYPAH